MNGETGTGRLPGGLAVFRRALGLLGVVELNVAWFAFSAAVVLNMIQIFLRFAFDTSIWWVQEVSLLLMMIAYFIGIGYVFRMRQYVIVHFAVDRLPPRWQLRAYLFAQALTIVFSLVVLIEGGRLAPDLMTTYSVIMHLLEFYWTLPLLIASASMILSCLYYGLAVRSLADRQPAAPLEAIESEVLVEGERIRA